MTKRKTKQQQIDELNAKVSQLQRESHLFNERLSEARRRTIPIRNMGGEVNFLPMEVISVDVDQDVKTVYDGMGIGRRLVGRSQATIICEGELIHVPAQPEPKKKPQPDLGWKIMNEYADKIKDNNLLVNFLADGRMLESGFTSGQLSEDMYRFMLRMMLPKDA